MIRLWSRSGLRALSILVLLLGLVGGGYLSVDRHNQQIATASTTRAQLDFANQQQQAAAYQAGASVRSQLAAAREAVQKQADAAAAAAAAKAQKAENNARKAHTTTTTSRSATRKAPAPSYGPVPKSCKTYSGNREVGCTLLLAAGFGLDQMPCLDKMWTKESNWRTTAENASSGAYGIPQALPASKMAAYGSDYRSNPVPQIKWGLHYIQGRYNSPCGAWSFWQAHNWY